MKFFRPVSSSRALQRGNTILESAVSLPVFMLLILGAMDFSWGVYAYNFCAYASQDAARWASVNDSLSSSPATSATLQTYVQNEAAGLMKTRPGRP